MSDILGDALSALDVQQHGILGMKWGRRKMRDTTPAGETKAVQPAPGKKVVAKGGRKLPASEDAVKTAVFKQKAKNSTTDSLSTAELKALVTRMQLEKQYSDLTHPQNQKNNVRKGHDLLKEGLQMQQTYNQVMAIPGVRESMDELKKDLGGEFIKLVKTAK